MSRKLYLHSEAADASVTLAFAGGRRNWARDAAAAGRPRAHAAASTSPLSPARRRRRRSCGRPGDRGGGRARIVTARSGWPPHGGLCPFLPCFSCSIVFWGISSALLMHRTGCASKESWTAGRLCPPCYNFPIIFRCIFIGEASCVMSQGRGVPWASCGEWRHVGVWLLSPDPALAQRGLLRVRHARAVSSCMHARLRLAWLARRTTAHMPMQVAAWRARGRVPLAVEVTAYLVDTRVRSACPRRQDHTGRRPTGATAGVAARLLPAP